MELGVDLKTKVVYYYQATWCKYINKVVRKRGKKNGSTCR